jgi:hypothetical protein
MKKILLLCDVNNFPTGAFEFIKNLHSSEPLLLTGAFFHSINYDLILPTAFAFNPDPVIAYTDKDLKAVANNIDLFEEKCKAEGIEYRTHEESNEFKIADVIKETRFADLAILSEEVFCAHLDPDQPNFYMEQILHKAECPVLLVPENCSSINNVAIAYDGEKESMLALKYFCYLLPNLTQNPATIFYLGNQEDNFEIPDLAYLEEYAARHFTLLTVKNLHLHKKNYFNDWIGQKENTLLIAGSFNRSSLSNLIRKSFVEKTIEQHKVPIFIAHHS